MKNKKVIGAFIVGALAAGSFATAATTQNTSVVKA
jgi:hypothetical protein